jgi:hypothetical protein
MVKIYYKTPSSGLFYPSSQDTITTTFQRLDLSPSSGRYCILGRWIKKSRRRCFIIIKYMYIMYAYGNDFWELAHFHLIPETSKVLQTKKNYLHIK